MAVGIPLLMIFRAPGRYRSLAGMLGIIPVTLDEFTDSRTRPEWSLAVPRNRGRLFHENLQMYGCWPEPVECVQKPLAIDDSPIWREARHDRRHRISSRTRRPSGNSKRARTLS